MEAAMRIVAASLPWLIVLHLFAQAPGGGKSLPGSKPKSECKPKADAKPKPKPIKDPLTIKVATTTGSANRYANSDAARVYILLNGDPTKKFRLTSKSKPFQRGATDRFERKNIDFDPTKIETIRLSNESSDVWKCETVAFQFFRAGRQYRVIRHAPGQVSFVRV
jgi:hypothetical protein